MFSKKFAKDLAERAIATAVETAIPMIGAVELVNELDYKHAFWVVATAVTLSVLKGIGAKLKGDQESASLVE